MVRRLMWVGVLVAGAAALSGCYAHGRVHATTPRAHTSGVVVYHRPPPPRVVVHTPPPAPYESAVWVSGHWEWNGAQYVWIDGHYVQSRPGYVYVQPRWERRGNGYVYVRGTWRAGGHRHGHVHRHGRQVHRPRHHRSSVRVRSAPPRARGRATVRVR